MIPVPRDMSIYHGMNTSVSNVIVHTRIRTVCMTQEIVIHRILMSVVTQIVIGFSDTLILQHTIRITAERHIKKLVSGTAG